MLRRLFDIAVFLVALSALVTSTILVISVRRLQQSIDHNTTHVVQAVQRASKEVQRQQRGLVRELKKIRDDVDALRQTGYQEPR